MQLSPEDRTCLQRGVDHFRAGDYFAAHDDWEEVWQGLRGRPRLFWQAMIQLVVGAYHLKNRNRKGCLSVWHKALQKCQDLGQTSNGEIPAPLALLTELLVDCLTAVEQQEEEPWDALRRFAHDVLSEDWFAFC